MNTDGMDKLCRTPFGRRLFESREDAGLTQEFAAKTVGMKSQATLAQHEASGKSSGFTPQLAKLYGVDPIWLATGKGQKKRSHDELVERADAPSELLDAQTEALLDAFNRLDEVEKRVQVVRLRALADESEIRRDSASHQHARAADPPRTSKKA